MSCDLTKLTGPELADMLHDQAYCPDDVSAAVVLEACKRLREDTRLWQRNIERDRDGLRAELEAERRKPTTIVSFDGQDQIDKLRQQCIELNEACATYAHPLLVLGNLMRWRKWAEKLTGLTFDYHGDSGLLDACQVSAEQINTLRARCDDLERRLHG